MSNRAKVVFLKEVADNLRDRRSVITAVLYALLGPLLLVPLIVFESHSLNTSSARVLEVAVEGADRAPGLIEYLRHRNIEAVAAPSDPRMAVRTLRSNIVVIIPDSYAAAFRAGHPATVRIVTDNSRAEAAGEVNRVTTAIGAYSETVGALRLVARGVDPNVTSAIALADDDVATPESQGALLLGVLPVFLMMSLFLGGLYVAVDVSAGERERGSFEPLMTTPLSAAEIVLGKLGAIIFFSFATTTITLVAFALIINLPFQEIPGLKFQLSFAGTLVILGALLPLHLPIGALQMLVASRSRTTKEAFTATSICSILPMIPGLFLLFAPLNSNRLQMSIPILSQNLLMNQVLRAAPISSIDYLLVIGTTLLLGVVMTTLAVATCANTRMLADR